LFLRSEFIFILGNSISV